MNMTAESTLVVKPNPKDPRLSTQMTGIDQNGTKVSLNVITERPLDRKSVV